MLEAATGAARARRAAGRSRVITRTDILSLLRGRRRDGAMGETIDEQPGWGSRPARSTPARIPTRPPARSSRRSR